MPAMRHIYQYGAAVATASYEYDGFMEVISERVGHWSALFPSQLAVTKESLDFFVSIFFIFL